MAALLIVFSHAKPALTPSTTAKFKPAASNADVKSNKLPEGISIVLLTHGKDAVGQTKR